MKTYSKEDLAPQTLGKQNVYSDFLSAQSVVNAFNNINSELSIDVKVSVTAETGYLKTYEIWQNGKQVGEKINIPKDYFVKSAKTDTVTTEDKDKTTNPPGKFSSKDYDSWNVDDKYIDLTINTKDSSGQETHVYLNVKDLAHVYTADKTTTISVDIDSADKITAILVEKSVGGEHLTTGLSGEISGLRTDVDSKINKAGDTDIGTLQLSGNLLVGTGLSVFGGNSIAAGYSGTATYIDAAFAFGDGGATAGTYTCEVISSNYDDSTSPTDHSQILLSGDWTQKIKRNWAVNVLLGTELRGASMSEPRTVISVDKFDNNTILTLDLPLLNTSDECLANQSGWAYFPDHPEVGNADGEAIAAKYGLGAMAVGDTCRAIGHDSFAQGIKSQAIGKFGRAMGYNNKSGWMATAIGSCNRAWGNGSIAMGGSEPTSSDKINCEIHYNSPRAFAWAGAESKYEISARPGTFNINPKGETLGFYIGHKNLSAIIREVVDGKAVPDTQARIIPGTPATIASGAEAFVDTNIDKYVVIGTDETTGQPITRQKTIDEIKAEADHLYAYIDNGDGTYTYKGIKTTQHKDVDPKYNTYEWRDLEERETVSYVKKTGDVNVGDLSLSGSLSVDSIDKFYVNGKKLNQLCGTVLTTDRNSCYVYGKNCVIGTMGYKISDTAVYSWTANGNTATLSVNNNKFKIDPQIAVDMYYSYNANESPGNDGYCGKVTAKTDYSITLSGIIISKVTDANAIFFPENQSLGHDEIVTNGGVCMGYNCIASGSLATAFGNSCKAMAKRSFVAGEQCRAGGYAAVALGTHLSSLSYSAFVGGNCNMAAPAASAACVFGINATAERPNTFVWNGNPSKPYLVSGDARNGSFNVNPTNGISGFYVNDTPLTEIISNNIPTDYVKKSTIHNCLTAFNEMTSYNTMCISSVFEMLSSLYVATK